MTDKILVTGNSVPTELLHPLHDNGYEIASEERLLTEEDLRTALSGVVGYLFGGDENVTAGSLQDANELRVISFLGVGYESFMDTDAVRAAGIAVTNTPGTLSASVAELTIGLLLDGVRLLSRQIVSMRSGQVDGVKTHELA